MEYEKLDSTRIGNKLRQIRTERGETAENVAKSIGVSGSAIAMYEIGQRVPRDEIKIRIAEHYGMSVESIFFPSI